MEDIADPIRRVVLDQLRGLDRDSMDKECERIFAVVNAERHKLCKEMSLVYTYIHRDDRKCCSDPSDVLGYIIQKVNSKENIIMYLEDAKEYILIKDVVQYQNFLTNAGRKSREDPDFKDFKKYRVILEDMEHNLVLMYKPVDADVERRLHDAIREKFGPNIRIIDNDHYKAKQVSTELLVSSLAESKTKCEELQDFIAKTDIAIAGSIQVLTPKHDDMTGKKYIMSAVKHDFENTVGDPPEISRDLLCKQVIVNVYNINGNVINGNVINNVVVAAPNEDALTLEWIRQNPPAQREATTDYHARYVVATRTLGRTPKVPNRMSGFVKTAGYRVINDGKKRRWVSK